MESIDFNKGGGLVPAIIQDALTRKVLMMGYMNRESLSLTIQTGKVTFFSRSRKRLWTKGDESGNFLYFEECRIDCDGDTLLVLARPAGPVCHTGKGTCFGQENKPGILFLKELESVIGKRRENPGSDSYTSSLFQEGLGKISRKVGEEAVELIVEAVTGGEERFLDEAADLLYHFMVLLKARDAGLSDVCRILEQRRKGATG